MRDKDQGETTERTHSRREWGLWEALMLRCQISKITFWEKTARAKIYTWFRQGLKTAQGTTPMQLLTNTFLIPVLTSLKISIPYTHTLRGETDCRESEPRQSFSMYVSLSSKAKQNKTPWILSKDNDRSEGRVNKTLVVGGGDSVGSTSQLLVIQHGDLNLGPQHPQKTVHYNIYVILTQKGRDRGICGARWPAKVESSKFNDKSDLKK